MDLDELITRVLAGPAGTVERETLARLVELAGIREHHARVERENVLLAAEASGLRAEVEGLRRELERIRAHGR